MADGEQGQDRRRLNGGNGRDRETLFNTATAIASAILGAAALLLAVVTQRPAAVLPWALIVLGALALVPLLNVPWRVRFGVTVGTATVLLVSGVLVWVSPDNFMPPPDPAPSMVTAPSTSLSGCLLTVTFKDTPPSNWTYAVANQAPGQTSFYFVGAQRNQATTDWAASMVVGTKSSTNTAFRIFVFALPIELRTVLEHPTGSNVSYWYQIKLLPQQRAVLPEPMTAQRDDQTINCPER